MRVFAFTLALLFFTPIGAWAQSVQGYTFTVRDAVPLLNTALVRAGAGDEVKATVTGLRDEDALAVASQPITVEVNDLSVDQTALRWQAVLLPRSGTLNLPPVRLTGRFMEMAQVPVLKNRMLKGEVIEEADVEWGEHPVSRMRKNTVMDVAELVGKTPKRMISPGRPIRQEEISLPSILDKGAQVTLIYRSQNLEIKTLGVAMEGGAVGDVIRVRNSDSKAMLSGVVEANNLVRISRQGSETAGLMP